MFKWEGWNCRAGLTRGLVGASIEPRDQAISLPKLNAVPVDVLPCRLDGCFVIGAVKENRFLEMAVSSYDVKPVVDHLRHPAAENSMIE